MSHGRIEQSLPKALKPELDIAIQSLTVDARFDFLKPVVAADANNRLPETDIAATRSALDQLGDIMSETGSAGTSPIPAIYTYFGQFIDHDITRIKSRVATAVDPITTDFTPMTITEAAAQFTNTRRAIFDLDSVYGDGPSFAGEPPTEAQTLGMYDGAKLRTSTVTNVGGAVPPFGLTAPDLLRAAGSPMAILGDERNDENLIVGQLHLAFVLFHNKVVANLKAANPGQTDRQIFDAAAKQMRRHYQWLVANDFLSRICDSAVLASVLADRASVYVARHSQVPSPFAFVPLEFTVAAYRFGHSMVRAFYDWNATFNIANNNAGFAEFFRFTGDGGMAGLKTFPSNWVADWPRMAEAATAQPGGMARPIDIFLAPPLLDLRNETGVLMRSLSRRNLRRGYLLSLPHGQALAQDLGLPVLTPTEVESGLPDGFKAAFRAAGFSTRTPLWYYCLQEAKQKMQGEKLGPLGSRLVAETIIGLLVVDPDSIMNVPGGWTPAQGVKLPNGREIRVLADVLRFAGAMAL